MYLLLLALFVAYAEDPSSGTQDAQLEQSDEALYQLAEGLYGNGEKDKAAAELLKLVKQYPDSR
jgi:TolA-binding protein